MDTNEKLLQIARDCVEYHRGKAHYYRECAAGYTHQRMLETAKGYSVKAAEKEQDALDVEAVIKEAQERPIEPTHAGWWWRKQEAFNFWDAIQILQGKHSLIYPNGYPINSIPCDWGGECLGQPPAGKEGE